MYDLYREGRATAAGLARIGIGESKASGIQAIVPVDLHAHEINAMSPVHDKADTVFFIHLIIRCFIVEAQHITEAGTSPALHAHAQIFLLIEPVFIHQSFNFIHRIFRKTHRS